MHPGGMQVTERFAAFAFSDYLRSGAATRLNLMHDSELRIATTADGSLTLHDSPAELHMVATLPSGDAYDQALELVRDGSTAETSVEFRALRERVSGDRRTVLQATLPAVGIVDRGAYGDAGAVEIRAKGRGISGSIPYGKPRTTSNTGRQRKRSYARGAFSYNIDKFTTLQADLGAAIAADVADEIAKARADLAAAPDVLLTRGRQSSGAVASMKAGSLVFEDTPDALTFEAPDVSATEDGRRLLELIDSVDLAMGAEPIYTMPPSDVVANPVRIEPEDDNDDVDIVVVLSALLHSIAILNRRELGEGGDVERRRRRVWL